MCRWQHHLEIPDEGLLPFFLIHCLQHLSGPTRDPGGDLERWPGLHLPPLVIPQPGYFQNAVPPHLLPCLVLVHAPRELVLCSSSSSSSCRWPSSYVTTTSFFVGNASSKFPSWGSFTPPRSLNGKGWRPETGRGPL